MNHTCRTNSSEESVLSGRNKAELWVWSFVFSVGQGLGDQLFGFKEFHSQRKEVEQRCVTSDKILKDHSRLVPNLWGKIPAF